MIPRPGHQTLSFNNSTIDKREAALVAFKIIKRMIPAWVLILIVSAGGFGCVSANRLSLESFSMDKLQEIFTKKDLETDSPNDRAIAVVPANNGIPENQSRIALVVGNSKYRYASRLANPRNDAKDMRQTLKQMGFQVQYLFNAPDDKAMARAVKKFGERLSREKNSVGLFFYAGHALQVDGVNYLIPVNAKIRDKTEVEFDTFNMNRLLATLDRAGNDFNIVILDACRDNPFRGFTRGASRGLAQMLSPQGTYTVFATAPGKTAGDGQGRNGTFTKHLLKHIREPGIKMEEMFKRVRRGVIAETHDRQHPWTSSDFNGDFYFGGCSNPLEKIRRERALLEEKEREVKEKLTRLKNEKTNRIRKNTAGASASTAAIQDKINELKKEQEKMEEKIRKAEEIRRELEQMGQNRPAAKKASMPIIAF